MTKIKGNYSGELRCELIHEKSGSKIITDAPVDNNGKGESFSPTDLVAAALGSCMLTIIGIRAKSKNMDIGTPSFSILKEMNSNPRKIERVSIEIQFEATINDDGKIYLEKEARNCPVALSINPDIEQKIEFKYA